MKTGLEIAWNLGIRKLVCESDSLTMTDLVSKPLNPCHWYSCIVSRIKQIMAREWEVMLSHTLREGNMVADWLAKFGALRDESLVELENPPQGIRYLLLADVMGVRYSRV